VALQCQTLADATDVPAVREKLVRLRHRIDAHIGEARELIWHLRSPTLERNDFITALRRMADDLVEGSALRVEFRICGRVRTCPPQVQRELLRIAQEAISNAVRHGRPTLVTIELHFEDAAVRLCVTDDGRGFTPPPTLTADEGHYGLAMMRERAEEIGGRFSVRSLPDQGASIEATAPLPAGAA
jgi:signal transduction histidine kinase